MAKLTWDKTGSRLYETGTKNGVLWVMNHKDDSTNMLTYGDGVAWNGLTAVTESPSGAEETALYADDVKYLSLRSTEEFGCTIEAYTYPDEFMACDGSEAPANGVVIGQQKRATFAFSYITVVGNDTEGNDYGYKIHIIYGCTASPSERAYATINDSPEAITFSWEVTTIPVSVDGFKPTALITVDSTKLTTNGQKAALGLLERILYGGDSDTITVPSDYSGVNEVSSLDGILGDGWKSTASAQLLMPAQIIALFANADGTAGAG